MAASRAPFRYARSILKKNRSASGEEETCLHEVDVAAQRVDLAVVRQHAQRMGPLPAGERVGREARVHQRQVRLVLGPLSQKKKETWRKTASELRPMSSTRVGPRLGPAGNSVFLFTKT